jgi:hypothetical protein
LRPDSPRLIAPPIDERPIYPYARVWLALALFSGLLLVVVLVIFVLDTFVLQIDRGLYTFIDIGIALLPAALWALLALLPERTVLEPRRGLVAVFLITAIVANGVTLPVINGVFQIDRWMPLADDVTRIIGYTVTVGMAQQLTQYLVVRGLVWEGLIRVRLDAVAYAIAAAVGYATALNLVIAFEQPSAPGASAFGVFTTVAFTVAPALLVAYGLGEARLSQPNPFLLPVTFALAAIIYSIANTLRSNLVNASLTLGEAGQVSAPSPLFGVAIAAALLVALTLVVVTFIVSAERRESEIGRGL